VSGTPLRIGGLSGARDRALAWAPIVRLLPHAGLAGIAAIVVAGLSIKAAAGGLGTPLPPFLMAWRPALHPLVLGSVAALVGAVLGAPVLVQRLRSSVAFAWSMYGLALALGLSLNVARAGAGGWWTVFATGRHGSFEGGFEYLLPLPLLSRGTGYYLSHFSSLFPYLTTHVKGNPPGPLIALHLLGVDDPRSLAAICIGIGAMSAPLAYDLGRVLGGEQRGRLAGVLTAFSPAMLLFGVTSADYAFATFGLIGACLLARRGTGALVAGSLAVAIASFFSWLLLAIGAWAAILALARGGRRRAAAICAVVGLAVAGFNAALAVAYGYDPFAALSATAQAYHHGVAMTRPYAFWVFGSPVAWAVALGLPITWLGLRSLSRADPAAVATFAVVFVASLVGLTKAETERIWLPFVPLACVAAASAVRPQRLRALLAALAAQAMLFEVLFFTVW
jgi:hypothetical protein